MPEVRAEINLDNLSPQELDTKRREITARITSIGYDKAELSDLEMLSAIASTLRRRSAGPPKVAKSAAPKGPKKKLTSSEALNLI